MCTMLADQGRGGGHVAADLGRVLRDLQGREVAANLLHHHWALCGEVHAHAERVVENISQPRNKFNLNQIKIWSYYIWFPP